MNVHRRRFLATSAAVAGGPLMPDLSFLSPLLQAVADTQVGLVKPSSSIEQLIRLIRTTPRGKCIPVFVEQLREGLSYHDLLSALFLAAVEHGDPHQVAGVYAAHRVSNAVRTEERLLPLLWSLDRITMGFEEPEPHGLPKLEGTFPAPAQAASAFQEGMTKLEPEQADRAIVVLARACGARQAMPLLWEFSARRVCGTLGHHPIMLANTWRTLEALGWDHAEPVLRYLARAFASDHADRTYEPNRERARKAVASLPAGWAANEPHRSSTLELYQLLRQGNTDATCDLICERLTSGRTAAGAVWDAVHLVAADLLFRYKTGGGRIGGGMVHAVTSTNALRCGFNCSPEDRVRLLLMLQAVAILGDLFVLENSKEGQLRKMNLLDLTADGHTRATLADVFSVLPKKSLEPFEGPPEGRQASDEASRTCFSVLQSSRDLAGFTRTALGLLCAKATHDAHDLKYPVAAFEDAALVTPEWRPYLLAASVHALHGSASDDSAALVQARQALG